MKHRKGKLERSLKVELYYQDWRPEQETRGTILLVHGSGEHCGRYGNVVDYFSKRGYRLYGFDFRGHGKSSGPPAHVLSWQEYRDDLAACLQMVIRENPDSPVYLYGHSMGGNIALDYLTQQGSEGVAGAIVSAPALAEPEVSPLLVLAARFLSRVLPGFKLHNGLDVNSISRDPEAVKAYVEDPLVTSGVSARYGTEVMAAIERVQINAHRIDIPLLLFHGEDDQIISATGTQQYFENVQTADKKLILYPGGFHEPHNDTQKQQVFSDIEKWLENHEQESLAS